MPLKEGSTFETSWNNSLSDAGEWWEVSDLDLTRFDEFQWECCLCCMSCARVTLPLTLQPWVISAQESGSRRHS
jgi:hypothetical protein